MSEWRYDGAGRLLQTCAMRPRVDGDGSNVAFGAVPLPPPSPQDRTERNFYDAEGRLAGKLDAEGYVTTFKYTAAGLVWERVTYATRTPPPMWVWGTLAQLTQATSPADVRELTFYNGKGLAVATQDGEGGTTEMVYDANGNLTQTVRYAAVAPMPMGMSGPAAYSAARESG